MALFFETTKFIFPKNSYVETHFYEKYFYNYVQDSITVIICYNINAKHRKSERHLRSNVMMLLKIHSEYMGKTFENLLIKLRCGIYLYCVKKFLRMDIHVNTLAHINIT